MIPSMTILLIQAYARHAQRAATMRPQSHAVTVNLAMVGWPHAEITPQIGMVKVDILFPEATFQMLISPVTVALIRNGPLGWKTNAVTAPADPVRVWLILPVVLSHRMIWASSPPLASS